MGAFVEDLKTKGVNPVSPFGVDEGVDIVDCIDTGVSGRLGGLVVTFIDTGVSGCCGGGVVLGGGVPQIHSPQGGGVVGGRVVGGGVVLVRRWGIVEDS